jgi:hypothetical protein
MILFFSFGYAHRFSGASSMWERGCIGSTGFEDFTLIAFLYRLAVFFSGNAIQAEPTFKVYCYGRGKAMSRPFFLPGHRPIFIEKGTGPVGARPLAVRAGSRVVF